MQNLNLHQNTNKHETLDPDLSVLTIDNTTEADHSLIPTYSNLNKRSKLVTPQSYSSNLVNQNESIIGIIKENEDGQKSDNGETKKEKQEKKQGNSMESFQKKHADYSNNKENKQSNSLDFSFLSIDNLKDQSPELDSKKGYPRVSAEKVSKKENEIKSASNDLTAPTLLISKKFKTREDETEGTNINAKRRKIAALANSSESQIQQDTTKPKLRKGGFAGQNNPSVNVIMKRVASVFVAKTEIKYSKNKNHYPFLVIPHRSKCKIVWDSIFQIVLLAVWAWIPIQIAFLEDNELIPDGSPIFVSVILAFYWLDIFLKMRTTYLTSEFVEVIDSKNIAWGYVKSSGFFFDFISSIPVYAFGYLGIQGDYRRLLLVNLLIRLRQIRLSKMEILLPISFRRIWRLMITIIKFMMIIHVVTCIWHLSVSQLSVAQEDQIESWIPPALRAINLDPPIQEYLGQGNFLFKYFYAAYNILMLMTGNDITPTSTFQACLCVIISIIGNMGLGFIFGSISFLIQQINRDHTMYHEKLEILQRNLIQNQVPDQLRNRVYDYFDVYWQKKNQFNRFSDFSELSEPLQRELAFHIHQDLIKTVPLFRELESIEIFSIIKKLQSSVYLPGDRIIREGDYGQEMFFINEGTVEVVIKKATETTLKTTVALKKGDHFGEIALISNSRRTSDVSCTDFCMLEKYSKKDYLKLQEKFPDIKIRLRKGLKIFKEIESNKIAITLKNIPLFGSFSIDLIQELVKDYLEEKFLDPLDIILKPKKRANALYLILMGTIKEVSPDDKDVIDIIERTKKLSDHRRLSLGTGTFKRGLGTEEEYASNFHCLDDDVEKGADSCFDPQEQLEGKILQAGDYFGGLIFDTQQLKSVKNYYIAESGCQILLLSQRTLDQIKENSPKLYEEVRYRFKERLSHSNEREPESPGKWSLRKQKEQKSGAQSPIRTNHNRLRMVQGSSGPQLKELDSVNFTLQQIENSMQSLKKQLGLESPNRFLQS